MMWQLLPILILISKTESKCDFVKEVLCGDECIGKFHYLVNGVVTEPKCQCGTQALSINDLVTYYCCNTLPCQNGTCPDGVVHRLTGQPSFTDRNLPCHGKCPIGPRNGELYFLCHNHDFCMPESVMCKGTTSCASNDFSMIPKERLFCSTEDPVRCQGLDLESCGQVPGATYTNVGCFTTVQEVSAFQCANRMDLADSMFTKPITDTSKYVLGGKAINFNTELNFNETHLICSDSLVITWENLIQYGSSGELCELNNGDNLPIMTLIGNLLLDYSFKVTHEIEKVWNMTFIGSLMCQYSATAKCPNLEQCINTIQFCDGVINCPNGQDESFEKCNFTFPSTATIKCHKKDIYNMNITILAVPCDGIIECIDGQDEAYCTISEIYTLISVICGYILILIMTFLLWRQERVNEVIDNKEVQLESSEPLVKAKHGSEEWAAEIVLLQEAADETERREISGKIFELELNQQNGSKSEAISNLKVKIKQHHRSGIFDHEVFSPVLKV